MYIICPIIHLVFCFLLLVDDSRIIIRFQSCVVRAPVARVKFLHRKLNLAKNPETETHKAMPKK